MKKLCRVLEVTRSGYYAWVKEGCPKKSDKDAVMLAKIYQVERDNHHIYGVRRVHKALCNEMDTPCSRSRVQRIMHDNGIKAKIKSKYKPQTTKADPNETAFPNLLNQAFEVIGQDRVWLADITYIRVSGKWAYLAAVLDLGTRKIVGWSLGASPNAELASAALRRAVKRHKPPKGLIHHSDRGCQYTSGEYKELLKGYNMVGSMSRKGNPYDNAPMESFFHTLKVEWVKHQSYMTMQQAGQSLSYYIDVYYNYKRLHSSLGYKSPKYYVIKSKSAI